MQKRGNQKRTFSQIRKDILLSLVKGEKPINSIASENNINWKTVDNHLTFLVGRGFASEVFASEYVRIFKITDIGVCFINRYKDNPDFSRSVIEFKKEVL